MPTNMIIDGKQIAVFHALPGITTDGMKLTGEFTERPFSRLTLQVTSDGATPTDWTVTLSKSLDGINWVAALVHNQGGEAIGAMMTGIDNDCMHYKIDVADLDLGSATALNVYLLAKD